MNQNLLNSLLIKRQIKQGYFNNDIVEEVVNQNQRLLLFSPQNIWVHNCFFLNIHETEEGGAILMRTNSNRTLLFVEETYFLNCSSYTYRGGAIYQTPGNFKMRAVCGILNDKELLEGGFIYSISTNTYDHFQEIEYCTCSVMFVKPHLHYGLIRLLQGCISIKYLNISHQKYLHGEVLLPLLPYDDFKNNDIQYSSFVNNTSDISYGALLYFEAPMNCYMCNILRNNARVIFSVVNSLTIKNSCIMENDYNQLVSQSSSSYYTYLYNCTCQNATSNYQSYLRNYNIPSSSFLHALDCLQTGLCAAQYDYLDDLNPYIPDDENDISVDSLSNINFRKKKNLIFP